MRGCLRTLTHACGTVLCERARVQQVVTHYDYGRAPFSTRQGGSGGGGGNCDGGSRGIEKTHRRALATRHNLDTPGFGV